MENDLFIELPKDSNSELIEVKTKKKSTPKRVTVIYELNTTQSISEEVKEVKPEDLPG